jgi:hypothetical protein
MMNDVMKCLDYEYGMNKLDSYYNDTIDKALSIVTSHV